jgi:hypothetical protein
VLNCVYQKKLPFWAVLMDTWYATSKMMLQIEKLGIIYCCPLKNNRQVDSSGGTEPYQRVDSLAWTKTEESKANLSRSKDFLVLIE